MYGVQAYDDEDAVAFYKELASSTGTRVINWVSEEREREREGRREKRGISSHCSPVQPKIVSVKETECVVICHSFTCFLSPSLYLLLPHLLSLLSHQNRGWLRQSQSFSAHKRNIHGVVLHGSERQTNGSTTTGTVTCRCQQPRTYFANKRNDRAEVY